MQIRQRIIDHSLINYYNRVMIRCGVGMGGAREGACPTSKFYHARRARARRNPSANGIACRVAYRVAYAPTVWSVQTCTSGRCKVKATAVIRLTLWACLDLREIEKGWDELWRASTISAIRLLAISTISERRSKRERERDRAKVENYKNKSSQLAVSNRAVRTCII